MKKMILNLIKKLTFFSLLFAANCFAENDANVITITVDPAEQLIPYTINPEVQFETKSSFFYVIKNEIRALKQRFYPPQTVLLDKPEAINIAPTLHNIINTKMTAIAQRMNLDVSTTKIGIKFTDQDTTEAYNAHAQTKKTISLVKTSLVRSDGVILNSKVDANVSHSFNLVLNEETVLLLAWYEATGDYASKDGLLDAVIGHELGHIYHKHMDNNPACEYEADLAGARCIKNPANMIRVTDLLSLTGNLFVAINSSRSTLAIQMDDIYEIINVVTRSLMVNLAWLGYLGFCSTHTELAIKVQTAIAKAVTRVQLHHAQGDKKVIASLLYDELKNACQTKPATPSSEEYFKFAKMETVTEITHPAPLDRRNTLVHNFSKNN